MDPTPRTHASLKTRGYMRLRVGRPSRPASLPANKFQGMSVNFAWPVIALVNPSSEPPRGRAWALMRT